MVPLWYHSKKTMLYEPDSRGNFRATHHSIFSQMLDLFKNPIVIRWLQIFKTKTQKMRFFSNDHTQKRFFELEKILRNPSPTMSILSGDQF